MKNKEWNWTDNMIPTSQFTKENHFLLTAVIYETMEKI